MTNQECRELVDGIVEYMNDNRPAELGGTGYASEYVEGSYFGDVLSEYINSMSPIYTADCHDYLRWSPNEHAMVEICGTDSLVSSGSIDYMAMTYYALYEDVTSHPDFVDGGAFDLDDIIQEMKVAEFERLTNDPDFLDEVRDLVCGSAVPRWSSKIEIDYIGDIKIEYMPNSSIKHVSLRCVECYEETEITL